MSISSASIRKLDPVLRKVCACEHEWSATQQCRHHRSMKMRSFIEEPQLTCPSQGQPVPGRTQNKREKTEFVRRRTGVV